MKISAFCVLWIGCILGSLAALPYILQLTNTQFTRYVLLLTCVQAVIVWAIIVFLGLLCAEKAAFKLIQIQTNQSWYSILKPSIIGGIFVSSILIFFDLYVFTPPTVVTNISRFQGFISSLYGAINEEVLLRLFLLSLFVVILQTVFPKCKRTFVVWSSIVLSAIIFGLAHLPALHAIAGFSALGITRVIALNGVAGLVFGYLYWRYGLVASMLAHFIADIIVHGILI